MRNFYRLFWIMAACWINMACSKDEYDWVGRERVLSKIYSHARATVKRKYKLNYRGSHMAAFQGPVAELGIEFIVEKDVPLEEANKLLVCVFREFYHAIQSSAKLDNYLAKPPLTENEVEVVIIFDHSRLSDYPSPFVSSIGVYHGEVLAYLRECLDPLVPPGEISYSLAELQEEFPPELCAG